MYEGRVRVEFPFGEKKRPVSARRPRGPRSRSVLTTLEARVPPGCTGRPLPGGHARTPRQQAHSNGDAARSTRNRHLKFGGLGGPSPLGLCAKKVGASEVRGKAAKAAKAAICHTELNIVKNGGLNIVEM